MAGCSTAAFFKEFSKLTKSVGRLTEGQGTVSILDFDEEIQRNFFILSITPNSGHYKDATCKFKVRMSENFPTDPPQVHCLNRVYHPNIDLLEHDYDLGEPLANICVNLLDSDWSESVGLDGAVMAVLFLLHNPNIDDSLNPLIDSSVDEEEFAELVVKACSGESVEGHEFDRLYPLDEDTETEEEGVTEGNSNGAGLTASGEEAGEATTTEANSTETNVTEARRTETNPANANTPENNMTEANTTGTNMTESNRTGANSTNANTTDNMAEAKTNVTETRTTEENKRQENTASANIAEETNENVISDDPKAATLAGAGTSVDNETTAAEQNTEDVLTVTPKTENVTEIKEITHVSAETKTPPTRSRSCEMPNEDFSHQTTEATKIVVENSSSTSIFALCHLTTVFNLIKSKLARGRS